MHFEILGEIIENRTRKLNATIRLGVLMNPEKIIFIRLIFLPPFGFRFKPGAGFLKKQPNK
jgi:hypothetical protein